MTIEKVIISCTSKYEKKCIKSIKDILKEIIAPYIGRQNTYFIRFYNRDDIIFPD